MQEGFYGVLKSKILDIHEHRGDCPHFHIHTVGDKVHYRISISVESQLPPNEVLYYIDQDFQHTLTRKISDFPFGFTSITEDVKTQYGIDFLRGNIVDITRLQPIPDQLPGPDNDLNEKIYAIMKEALEDKESILYAFGEKWNCEGKDRIFHFSPGEGIHDIHMNQSMKKDNSNIHNDSAWQDGALLIHYPIEDKWKGIFIAFQNQLIHC
jgi:uncharacterized protein YukJ